MIRDGIGKGFGRAFFVNDLNGNARLAKHLGRDGHVLLPAFQKIRGQFAFIDKNLGDACLNNRTCAVTTREVGDIKGTPVKRCAGVAGVVNRVAFGMFGIGVFFRALMAAFDIVIDTAWKAVIANRTDFLFRADDNGPDLGAAVF